MAVIATLPCSMYSGTYMHFLSPSIHSTSPVLFPFPHSLSLSLSLSLPLSVHNQLTCTQCETYATVALDALYTQLLHPPTKIGIIGSGCSVATETTAQVSHYYNITHVSSVNVNTVHTFLV